MDVADVLSQHRDELLDDAAGALKRSRALHYERSGDDFTRDRLAELADLVITALRDRELDPVGQYCERIADERFQAGFATSEVQIAFNVLEEAKWSRVVTSVPPDELPQAIGLLSTILGFGKDALARRYVSLASRRHVPTLDLTALFQGVVESG